MRRVTTCALALATLAAAPAAALTIDFSSAEGGAKTRVSLSGTNTVAFGNNTIVSNFQLPFDLVDAAAIPGIVPADFIELQTFTTDIGALTATGSTTGSWEVSNFRIVDNMGLGLPEDEIVIELTSPDKVRTETGETLTFDGSATVDLPFAAFVSGGLVSTGFLDDDVTVTVGAAPDMGVVPLPATGLLLAGAVAGLGALRRRR